MGWNKRHYLYLTGMLVVVFLGYLLIWPGRGSWQESWAFQHRAVPLHNPGQRVLVLAPHPDDETFATGGVLERTVHNHDAVMVVVVTSGNHFYKAAQIVTHKHKIGPAELAYLARVRQGESRKAMQILGVPQKNLLYLGYPDTGLTPILKGRVTRDGLTLEGLDARLAGIIDQFHPTDIYYPCELDDHPDHRALSIIISRLLAGRQWQVRQHQYLVHYRQNRWPSFPGLYHYLPLMPPLDLYRQGWQWESLPLTADEVSRKLQAINQYQSQLQAVGGRYLTYGRSNELYVVEQGAAGTM